jgi:3-oxoacyl-[acyl-carrier-protein] synthase-3
MAYLAAFGSYVPSRVVDDTELAQMLGVEAEWVFQAAGIEERRYASTEETVAFMAVKAAENCLARAGMTPDQVGMLIVSSGSSEFRFPGPAAATANRLGLGDKPCIDLPMASTGALFGMAIAAQMSNQYDNILVVASEKMSTVVLQQPMDKNTAILFGDGAGACLIRASAGEYRILDTVLHSDGSFAADLQLGCGAPLQMNGRSVIMQASRKIPAVILEVLKRNQKRPGDVAWYLMHQANQNLMNRVAKALDVSNDCLYSNISKYGNTSSASMLIAADEWHETTVNRSGTICFAVFGAGYHWGAMLAQS